MSFLISAHGVQALRHTPAFEIGVLNVLSTAAFPSLYPTAGEMVAVKFVVQSTTARLGFDAFDKPLT